MASLVFDTGALIALERGDRDLWMALDEAASASIDVLLPVGALAQAWRGSPGQARLARALKRCHEVPLDGQTARELGALCGKARTDDVIDASVAVTAARALQAGAVDIFTSDRSDIAVLLAALDAPANVVEV